MAKNDKPLSGITMNIFLEHFWKATFRNINDANLKVLLDSDENIRNKNPSGISTWILRRYCLESRKDFDENSGSILQIILRIIGWKSWKYSEENPGKILIWILGGFWWENWKNENPEGLWWESWKDPDEIPRILENWWESWKDTDKYPGTGLMRILGRFWGKSWKDFDENRGTILIKILEGFQWEFWRKFRKDSDENQKGSWW